MGLLHSCIAGNFQTSEEELMNRFKVLAAIICLSLSFLIFAPEVKADDWNKKTTVTFNEPVEIPGVGQQFLPAGTYVFLLMDSSSDRHIVQIFNADQTHLYATILTIANYRLKSTNRTVMTFRERSAGSPEAIRAWFYPGDNWGQEFVYPKARAIELAKITNQPVLAMPSDLATYITIPVKSVNEPPVVALKEAPLKAVKPTGEEVEITQVVEPPPAQAEVAQTATKPVKHIKRLPQTASPLPLLTLIGLLSLATSFTLWLVAKRSA
jgi:hypothetical protein